MYFSPRKSGVQADDLTAVSLLYEIFEDSVGKECNYFICKASPEEENYYGI
jgi:hypothetical protein